MEETRLRSSLPSSRTRFHSRSLSASRIVSNRRVAHWWFSCKVPNKLAKSSSILSCVRYGITLFPPQTGIDFSPVGWVITSARIAYIEPQMTRKTACKARGASFFFSPSSFSFFCVKIALLPSWTIDHPICEYYRSLRSDTCKRNSPLPCLRFIFTRRIILAKIRTCLNHVEIFPNFSQIFFQIHRWSHFGILLSKRNKFGSCFLTIFPEFSIVKV